MPRDAWDISETPKDIQEYLRGQRIWGVSPESLGSLDTLSCLGAPRGTQDILSDTGGYGIFLDEVSVLDSVIT